MITWLFFDVGGTLFDEEPIYRYQEELIFALLNKHGCVVAEKEFTAACRAARRHYLPRYVNHLIWIFTEDMARYEAISLEYERTSNKITYPQFKKMSLLMPGMRDLLMDVRQRFMLGLIGNQPAIIRERLEDEGLMDLFTVQAISAEMGMRKPDLRFFLGALAMAHCRADEAVMIGDRLDNDVFPARMLGMTTVRLKVGPHKHQPVLSPEYLPHFTVNSVQQLGKLIHSDSFVARTQGAEIMP